MEPNREGPQHNFELPPQPESLEGEDKRQEKGVEGPAAPQEQAGKQAPAPALPVIPDDIPAALPPVIAVPVQDGDSAALPVSAHPAGDIERIEPVWVDKAKEIIARTHDDPYLQKDQMSKVKAEYIQKRFNKQIKTDEAPA
jgi:hypothetical protein